MPGCWVNVGVAEPQGRADSGMNSGGAADAGAAGAAAATGAAGTAAATGATAAVGDFGSRLASGDPPGISDARLEGNETACCSGSGRAGAAAAGTAAGVFNGAGSAAGGCGSVIDAVAVDGDAAGVTGAAVAA